MKHKEKVYLIDGSGYIFRAYYAVHSLSTSNGFPTNALFGFTRMLLKLLEQASEHVVMVFDAGKETFRNEMYSEYKANRDECPEDLVPQMPYFREISKALGLRILELPGYEADDLIGTCVEKLKEYDIETVIVSADKDLMQLVNQQVVMWDTMRDKVYKEAEVKEKFGVTPDKVVEVLALMGDSSDNIPGVSGVGAKTATQLIEKYGTVAQLIESTEEIKNDKGIRNRKKIAEAIELDPEIARLSRQLVEIKTDCPLEVELNGETVNLADLNQESLLDVTLRQEPDSPALLELIEKLEFTSLFKNLDLSVKKQEADSNYQTIYAKDFSAWVDKLKAQEFFAFDLETDSLDPLDANLVGASFCWDQEEAYYIPIAHLESEEQQVDIAVFLNALRGVLENSKIKKAGQNLKYDIRVLKKYKIEVAGVSFDSMLAAYLLNPDQGSFNLTTLAREYLNCGIVEYEEVLGEAENFAGVGIKDATHYAAQDAHYAWLLMQELKPKLEKEDLLKVFDQIEVPLVPVLASIEDAGISIDMDFLKEMSESLAVKLTELEHEIEESAGEKFNINSPKQLSHILFDKLNLPTKGLKKTKTGISTNVSTLEKLSSVHELPAKILDYRTLFKLKSTYVDALPEHMALSTQRLHTSLNQTVTATGRLSSSNPNLQNIPIQNEEGRRIRKAFVADKGNLIVAADYSQIELRILAHLSNDQNLIAAFQNEEDIHAETAREILAIPDDQGVSVDERRMGKTINFGIVYGMGGFRLSKELEIPVGVANQYISDYFEYYSGVREYFDSLEAELEDKGQVCTMFGRKRYLNNIDTSGRDKGFLVRAALNAPIQGTAADIIKLAMIKIQKRILAESLTMKMILQIHDELLFEIPEDFAEDAQAIIVEEMENVYKLKIPLKVSVGSGVNWEEAH